MSSAFDAMLEDMSDSDSSQTSSAHSPSSPSKPSPSTRAAAEKTLLNNLAESSSDEEERERGRVMKSEEKAWSSGKTPMHSPRRGPLDSGGDSGGEWHDDGGLEAVPYGEMKGEASSNSRRMEDEDSDEDFYKIQQQKQKRAYSAPSEALPEDSSDSEFEFQPHIDNGHEDSEDSDVEDRPSELEAKQLPSYAAAAPPSNSLQGQYSSNRMYSTGSNPYALSAASNDSSSHSGFGFRGASSAAIDSSTDDRFGMEASKIYNRGSSSLNVQPSNAEEESAPPDQPKQAPKRRPQESKETKSADSRMAAPPSSHGSPPKLMDRKRSPPRTLYAESKAPPPSPQMMASKSVDERREIAMQSLSLNKDKERARERESGKGHDEVERRENETRNPWEDETEERDNLTLTDRDRIQQSADAREMRAAAGEDPVKAQEAPRAKKVVETLTAVTEGLLMSIPGKGQPMRKCYVVRSSAGVLGGKTFSMFLEPLTGPPGGGKSGTSQAEERFMMSAYKKGVTKNSNYVLSSDVLGKGSVMGKLKGNWSGASYEIYDSGVNPERGGGGAPRQELGVVFYEYDRMGPGKMKLAVPRPEATNRFSGGKNGIVNILGEMADVDKLVMADMPEGLQKTLYVCQNKRPRWDAEQKGHVLNFKGRVTASSVKNFQLQCEGASGENTMLQFGRVNKNVFTLDYGYPLNAVQAFAVCISSMDGKLADSKGFDIVRKFSV